MVNIKGRIDIMKRHLIFLILFVSIGLLLFGVNDIKITQIYSNVLNNREMQKFSAGQICGQLYEECDGTVYCGPGQGNCLEGYFGACANINCTGNCVSPSSTMKCSLAWGIPTTRTV
jgi:hypothetical protein